MNAQALPKSNRKRSEAVKERPREKDGTLDQAQRSGKGSTENRDRFRRKAGRATSCGITKTGEKQYSQSHRQQHEPGHGRAHGHTDGQEAQPGGR